MRSCFLFFTKIGRISCCCLLAFIYTVSFAQDSIPKKKQEETVTIMAYRFPEQLKRIPFTTKKIVNKEWNMNAPTTADVLQNSGTVLVQKSQAGGGSPIIRGFEASRVLLMTDGIRMNNAIYRAGHLQNAISVDANILSSMDIVFGPSSTQYGSDALGGAINMLTKKPQLSSSSKTILSGNVGSRYSSAMQELQTHFDINIGAKKWASLTSITFSNFGDVMQGSKRSKKYAEFGKKNFYVNTISGSDYKVTNPNPNKQVVTAYQQTDFLQKISYVPKQGKEHILNVQYSTTNNVPRYDRLTELAGNLPRFAEWYYGPQKRLLAAYHFNADFENRYIQKLQSIFAFQKIEESRIDRRFGTLQKNNRIEEVALFTYTLDALHKKENKESHMGIDLQWNDVKSTAFTTNILSGVRQNNITTRYPNGKNRMATAAAYYQYMYNINAKTIVSLGARYTVVQLQSSFIENAVTQFPFTKLQQNNNALCGNLGITHNTQNNWKLAAIISSGFRSPNFDELKVFDSRAGFLIVPNENIKPEYTYNAEVNANKLIGKMQVGAAIFYTKFRNAIQVKNSTYNGNSTVLYQGVLSQVQAAQNSSKAYLYGTSVTGKLTVTKQLEIDGAITYTYGRLIDTVKVPLDHIPPVYGRLGVKFIHKKLSAETFSLFNGTKKLKDYSPSGEDNLQYATIDGMPNWFTLNLRTQYSLHTKMVIQFGIENLLDTNYRVFASGISAPGRNYIVALRTSF